MITETETITK